jgi:hypothetical protein
MLTPVSGADLVAILLSDELRLFYAVVLIVVPFVAGYRFSRRFIADRLTAATTAFVFFYAIQYMAVCLPGVGHQLNPISMGGTALGLSAVLFFAGRRATGSSSLERSERPVFTASLTFVLGYVGALVYHQALLPITSTDVLTYHAPAAVQWLQTHRLGVYETWFFNPANSYSPLAGSAFIAFLIGPMGNDVLARFVGVGPLIFLFFVLTDLLRRLNVRVAVAAVIAVAAVLARPFISQSIVAKDDLFVAAFAIATLNAMMMPADKRNPIGSIVAGLSLGLLLATKYTALYALPLVVLMVDGPLRRGWRGRDYAVAALVAIAMAGPWYARNWVLTGNPLYPTDVRVFGITLFRGMFQVQRSHLLESAGGVWRVFTASYFSAPMAINVVLILGWVVAVALRLRQVVRDPLHRAVLLGPAVMILFFAWTAPYGEFRFAYPALVLLFASVALVVVSMPVAVQLPVAVVCAMLSAGTAFRPEMVVEFIVTGIVVMGVVLLLGSRWVAPVARKVIATGAGVGVVLAVYIYWHAYIGVYRETGTYVTWATPTLYDGQAELWRFVREELPRGATIAYGNTYLTYPLMGFAHDHRVVYVPTRRNVKSLVDLPRISERVTGEEISDRVSQVLRGEADREQWLKRVRESGAEYLVIATVDPSDSSKDLIPLEQGFVASDPAHFERVYPSGSGVRAAGSVYRICFSSS